MLKKVAHGLGNLKEAVVFVGGAVTALYVDTIAAEEIRMTEDVDIMLRVASRREYHSFEKKLRKAGFKNDMSPGAPICRWFLIIKKLI